MPIRINLLAEQQTAEEMRRRDPVKRVLYLGVALTLLMLLWVGLTGVNVGLARHELSGYETRLKKVEEQSKSVKNNQTSLNDMDSKIQALDKYQRSRFFWATFLDAVQGVSLETIRLMEIKAEQRYSAGEAIKFYSTNVSVAMITPPPAWKFWAGTPKLQSLQNQVAPMLATITNKAPFTTNLLEYAIKVTAVSTNVADNKITTRVEFNTVPWTSERITIDVRGRDYGAPAGAAVDEFARHVNSSEYFKQLLAPTEGFRFTERPPQARTDLTDAVNPNALFVPFTIQLGSKERMFTNE